MNRLDRYKQIKHQLDEASQDLSCGNVRVFPAVTPDHYNITLPGGQSFYCKPSDIPPLMAVLIHLTEKVHP